MEENNSNVTTDQAEPKPIVLTEASLFSLDSVRKWAMFLAVIGFVACGMALLFGLLMIAASTAIPVNAYVACLMGIFYMACGVVYFFPSRFLLLFSRNASAGLNGRDSGKLETAFENLKKHYKFMGIITITGIGLGILGLIGMIIAAIVFGPQIFPNKVL
jgi:hypothetical protein